MASTFRHIRPLLQTGSNPLSRWFSYIGLGIGVLLLLCSIQMFVNIEGLLKRNVVRKNGYDYVSITKTVTDASMGRSEKNLFHPADIAELKTQPFVIDVAPLLANQFKVQLSAGKFMPFMSDLFLEAMEDSFIDTLPPEFKWKEGDVFVPVIFSADFLELYNVFAPSQDLPQVSEATASGIPFIITCQGKGKEQVFQGKIVALSDRVNSVLVPKTFLDWANQMFGETKQEDIGRVFIKTKDANDPALLSFLDQRHYKVNKDKIRFGRIKQVITAIFSGLGIFGLVVVILALMLFSFYLQLVITRSKENLQLLLTLGYSPRWLSRNVTKRFIPVYVMVILISLLFTAVAQWSFRHYAMNDSSELSPFLHWSVGLVALILIAVAVIINYRMVRKMLQRIASQ